MMDNRQELYMDFSATHKKTELDMNVKIFAHLNALNIKHESQHDQMPLAVYCTVIY